jgi:protein-S-isoprenylcysteine O-methyltransferase Ste14
VGGAVVAGLGVTIVALGRRELARQGQPTDPGRPTTNIVTSGIYSLSRNPLYLGATCFLAGVALAFNLPWVLVLLLPSLVACHVVLIAPEERYLAARFGDEYREYAATVHRWLGRARKHTSPVAGEG